MTKIFLGLSVLMSGAVSPTRAAPRASERAHDARMAPMPEQQGICCCQTFASGWRHAWMAPNACAQARGSCVSPDHCG